jgi:hypothetical protein
MSNLILNEFTFSESKLLPDKITVLRLLNNGTFLLKYFKVKSVSKLLAAEIPVNDLF